MSNLKSILEAEGNIVLPDSEITPANLAVCGTYVIGEAANTPTAQEIADLSAFVTSGKLLLIFTNSHCTGCVGANAILSGIGSTISVSTSFREPVPTILGGIFASEGPPYNIVGQAILTSPGNLLAGGTQIVDQFINWEMLGQGYVFVFADRIDHNFLVQPGSSNAHMFLNIANHGTQPAPVPAMTGEGMVVFGLLLMVGLFIVAYRKKTCRA
jgi:hypothetical protein